MRQSHLILSNALIIWISRILLLVPQLIMVPYLIQTIGEAGYGVYVLMWSLMMAIAQLQTSLQSGVVKYSAAFLAKEQIDRVSRVCSSAFVYAALLGVGACIGISVPALLLAGASAELSTSLLVISAFVLVTIPLTPYIAVIQSRQRYYVGVIAETLAKYVSLAVVIAWFNLVGPSVEALVAIMAGTLFLSRLAQVPVAYRMVPGLQNHVGLFDWQTSRRIASFGALAVAVSACLIANTAGVRWLMGILVSTSFVAHATIMLMPGTLLTQVVQAITITIMPAASAYEATGNRAALLELLLRGTRYTTILVIACLTAACVLMPTVLTAWVGGEYEFLAPYSLVLLSSSAFLLSTSPAHHMLKGLGRLQVVAFAYFVGLVLVPALFISVVLAIRGNPYFAVTAGIAMGNTTCGLLQMTFAMRAANACFRKGLVRAYAQPIIAALVVCPVTIAAVVHWEINGIPGGLCAGTLTVAAFFATVYTLFATPGEREQAREIVSLCSSRIARSWIVSPRLRRRSNADAS